MTVSVIVPTFNRGGVVGRAVESALAQTYSDLEVLVVDDGSTDDTAARMASLDDLRLRYVRRPHAGVSATRNAGAALATGDLIAFLDSDDLWKPDKLAGEVTFLQRHPEVQAVFSDLEKYDGDVFIPSFMRASPLFGPRLAGSAYPDGLVLSQREMHLYLLQEVFIKPSALTLYRTAFQRTGGFDESWSSSEDWEFLLRLAKWACFGYLDRPLAVLRLSADSLHRLDQRRGETAIFHLLTRERAALGHDPDARAAVQGGLRERAKQFAWYHEGCGRRLEAVRAYLRGFRVTRDPALLARAAGVWIPPALRRLARHTVAVAGAARSVVARAASPAKAEGGLF